MGTEEALLSAIYRNPYDDTLRYAYLDWLEEFGDTPDRRDRARLMQIQRQLQDMEPAPIRLTLMGEPPEKNPPITLHDEGDGYYSIDAQLYPRIPFLEVGDRISGFCRIEKRESSEPSQRWYHQPRWVHGLKVVSLGVRTVANSLRNSATLLHVFKLDRDSKKWPGWELENEAQDIIARNPDWSRAPCNYPTYPEFRLGFPDAITVDRLDLVWIQRLTNWASAIGKHTTITRIYPRDKIPYRPQSKRDNKKNLCYWKTFDWNWGDSIPDATIPALIAEKLVDTPIRDQKGEIIGKPKVETRPSYENHKAMRIGYPHQRQAIDALAETLGYLARGL